MRFRILSATMARTASWTRQKIFVLDGKTVVESRRGRCVRRHVVGVGSLWQSVSIGRVGQGDRAQTSFAIVSY